MRALKSILKHFDLNSKSKDEGIIAIDITTKEIIMSRFVKTEGDLRLVDFKVSPLNVSKDSDSDTNGLYRVNAIKEIMDCDFSTKGKAKVTVGGYTFFPRFVKLPPVSKDKVMQIIRYEAEQNVPFPMNEVMWDFWMSANHDEDSESDSDCEELSIMLIACKADYVQRYLEEIKSFNIDVDSVGSRAISLANVVKCGYKIKSGDTKLTLNIGNRSTDLVFLEGKKLFTRSIPVACNSIVQEIAKELGIPFDEAEELVKTGVLLSGVAEGDETSERSCVNRCLRNVMVRLHDEINRSINFYRSQQNGSPVKKVLITGCGSNIEGVNDFFKERLKVPVETLNPLKGISYSSVVFPSGEENYYHLLSGVVGSALQAFKPNTYKVNVMNPTTKYVDKKKKRRPFNICDHCPFR